MVGESWGRNEAVTTEGWSVSDRSSEGGEPRAARRYAAHAQHYSCSCLILWAAVLFQAIMPPSQA